MIFLLVSSKSKKRLSKLGKNTDIVQLKLFAIILKGNH